MNILGLNAYHGDSSTALVIDGELIAAAEEERFRRIKHWAGFPIHSIRYCLKEAGLSLADIDIVAINQDRQAHLRKKISYLIFNLPDVNLLLDRIRTRSKRVGVIDRLQQEFPGEHIKAQLYPVEHHVAHLSSAFHVSPFNKAVIASVDGFGDFASSAWGTGEGNKISDDGRIFFPHSLGIFYQALTQYLGFPNYGDEYKVMGLAAFGQPAYRDEFEKIVVLMDNGEFRLDLDYFRHQKEKISFQWNDGMPVFGELFSARLEELLGPRRLPGDAISEQHKNIAATTQWLYEKAFFNLLNSLHQKYQIDDLALAGGCAMNSVANGKVYRNTPFKKVYIQSAAGDAGGAIGAAFTTWYRHNDKTRHAFKMPHAYWGPAFSNAQIKQLLDGQATELDANACEINRIDDVQQLFRETAGAIAEGKIVGWFQGRMEWGPRALGNRSILCDPRRTDIKEILNRKIKRRESFRPFAPSILREAVSEWFEEDDDVPFMMKVFQIREEKRQKIPAVTHVDGSGRLQTVIEETNPRYYRLIKNFHDLTGVPLVLNTSFNENEPVVCKPEEALDCFLRTKMDVLVMEDYIITRSE